MALVGDGESLPDGVATALRATLQRGLSMRDSVVEFLRYKKLLVVLDRVMRCVESGTCLCDERCRLRVRPQSAKRPAA